MPTWQACFDSGPAANVFLTATESNSDSPWPGCGTNDPAGAGPALRWGCTGRGDIRFTTRNTCFLTYRPIVDARSDSGKPGIWQTLPGGIPGRCGDTHGPRQPGPASSCLFP